MTAYDHATAATYSQHRVAQTGVLQALLSLDVARSGARVLEVGCGTANHLASFCEQVACLGFGIDPSVSMLREAPVPLGGLVSAAAEAVPFARNSFDLIFSVDVVHHLQDLDAAYGGMAGLLKPGGLLLTATDSEETIRARSPLSSYVPEPVACELARYPSIGRLESVHQRHGLDVFDSYVVDHPYVLDNVTPFRTRVFSCLRALSDEALAAGIARLERDLPLTSVSRNFIMLARKS
ncbi:MAG: class I SAM-dependent methyltransferase [Anaerolineae bacterium]|nr:class I SAM-dependent methyltransferase [Anaerolineae bacterium]